MIPDTCLPEGAGLGLRRTLLGPLADHPAPAIDFFEIAPENWMGVGGRFGKALRGFTERYPFLAHGLSLSLGGPAPLDEEFLGRLKGFIAEHRIRHYSEHLSYCSDDGHLYDLMPLPFTEEAIRHVAARIRRTQEILEQVIAIENVSYYATPGKEMEEIDFLLAVLEEADCQLLLDINNVYVNSINHGYDAGAFLERIPGDRISYLHIAGHYREDEDLLIDTHGAAVVDPVWRLLEQAYARFGNLPTLLERDFDIPPLEDLLEELARIRALQQATLPSTKAARMNGVRAVTQGRRGHG
ncbi:DUF692 domain-containing protein [Thiohalobacter sp. IOR34]|uniref:HvfB family MNIO-type RiPP peptide maturase n=1 Tax=Thiohalobacter sp. IOR34 TaxID=3057176 RepID=UPI0025AED8F3|nr:DUF692 domain-containing protein [Thiohalobacter sp. IOR34]WJW76047.1 DUF692 domain-containing protein [Thiohalobacter sp. IOR34]